jgi:hypothetical protein
MQMYLLICCGAADVPATRILGREPAGQNSTGESDMRNYYDRLAADRQNKITPAMARLDEVLIRSVLGTADPDSVGDYTWDSLWQMTDAEKADISFKKSQAHKVDVEAGILNPNALRIGRENDLIEDGFLYPGFADAIEKAGEWDAVEDVDEREFANAKKHSELMPNQPDNDPGNTGKGDVGGGADQNLNGNKARDDA